MEETVAVPSGNVDGGVVNAMEGIRTVSEGLAHDMSMWGMFMQADFIVKGVILLLLASSFWCWKIIFEKFMRFREVNHKMREFEASIWSGDPLENRYELLKKKADYPLARVFVAGMYEWINSSKVKPAKPKRKQMNDDQLSMEIDVPQQTVSLKLGIKERVLQAMESTRNREVSKLEKDLGFLATVGSSAPFVGLFGTVWGIMRSFQSIATEQNTSLAVVAPGIAEALFATAIGLFAAIPAVIFYNKFSGQAAEFSDRIDSFIDEFSSVLGRELDE